MPVAAAFLALIVALAYIAYVSPVRLESAFDQYDYENVAGVLASKGVFGHAVSEVVVAEPRRTIGYPLFLAALIDLFGAAYPAAALIQALLFASLPPVIYLLARDILPRRAATLAPFAVALFAPLAYWAAFTMTEVFATCLVTLGTVIFYRALARSSQTWALVAGAFLGYASLVRPTLAFVVLALAVAAIVAVRALRLHGVSPRVLLTAVVAAMAIGVLPQVAYTRANFSRTGLTAYPPGLQVMVGYWQGVWPGRVSARLDALSIEHASANEIAATAQELRLDPSRVARYVEELRTFGMLQGEAPFSFVIANDWAFERAIEDIKADPAGFVLRGFTARTPTLLVGSIPVRYDQINSLPRPVLLLVWGAQALSLAFAAVGIGLLLRRRDKAALAGALVLGLALYVTAVHFPFFADPRYGLPAQPLLLLAAAGGAIATFDAVRRARMRLALARPRPPLEASR